MTSLVDMPLPVTGNGSSDLCLNTGKRFLWNCIHWRTKSYYRIFYQIFFEILLTKLWNCLPLNFLPLVLLTKVVYGNINKTLNSIWFTCNVHTTSTRFVYINGQRAVVDWAKFLLKAQLEAMIYSILRIFFRKFGGGKTNMDQYF